MNYRIEINCGNAAFDEQGPHVEISRILRALARRIEAEGTGENMEGRRGLETHTLRDINGNRVGTAGPC